MTKKTDLLFQRFEQKTSSKIRELAEKSASGSRSGFQGIFQVQGPTQEQKSSLESALIDYNQRNSIEFSKDIEQLMQLMLEVQAISHQALLLHGQRIQSAKEILKGYREGAFSTWLLSAYGNRQTPYNFLQYFEFFQALPDTYKAQVEKMPKQAIYKLASRDQPLQQKLSLLDRSSDCSCREFLARLRAELPLKPLDRRQKAHPICSLLAKVHDYLETQNAHLLADDAAKARQLCQKISALLEKKS